MTTDEKDLLESRSFWGLIVSVGAAIALHFGITIDQTAAVNEALVIAGLLVSAYGRIKAQKPVTSVFGLTTKAAADKAKAKSAQEKSDA